MISFTCKCGKKYEVPEKYAGKKVRCKKCDQINIIPRFSNVDQNSGSIKKSVHQENHQDSSSNCKIPLKKDNLLSINCLMCGKTVEVPKTAKDRLIKCPDCDSYLDTSSPDDYIKTKKQKEQEENEKASPAPNEPIPIFLNAPLINDKGRKKKGKRQKMYNENNFIDSILFAAFWLTKIFSGIVLIVCFIGIVGGILVYCNSEETIPESPTFYEYSRNDEMGYFESIMEAKNEYNKGINNDAWKSQLEDICKRHSLDRYVVLEAAKNIYSYYDKMRLDSFMESFLEGLDDFMGYAKKHYSKPKNARKERPAPLELFGNYVEIYESKVADKTVKTEIKSKAALAAIGISLVCFIMFIGLPLLVQIERNTRDL